MIRWRTPLVLLVAIGLATVAAYAPGQATAMRAFLLDVNRRQTFTEIGSNNQTKPELVEEFKELSGSAIKVSFAKGDSVGDSTARVKNWKSFTALRITAFNPGKDTITLGLNIFHAGSTNYATRIDVPVVLEPGRNVDIIRLVTLKNTNGSVPVFTDVRRWYFADSEGKAPTIYFGDVVLVGAVGQSRVQGDPVRLKRIRATVMPKFDKPILFNTPEADAIVSALEVFPPDNPWNLVIEDWPVHPNSKNIVASIGADKKLRYNHDMGYVLIPPNQKRVPVTLGAAAEESDKGPYPVPENTPIEGYPINYEGLTLDQVQRKDEGDLDRHALVVDPVNRMLYEFYQLRKTDKGWIASGAAIFNLKSNRLRPDGWTSADAAGLPIFPATVRYDEIKRGMVEHAMRFGVQRTRRAYVDPATHFASSETDENLPRMGERFRLRKDFDVSGFSPEAQAILKGLKKYGMFVADNGLEWTVSVAPDPRIPLLHEEFSRIKGAAFEVVERP